MMTTPEAVGIPSGTLLKLMRRLAGLEYLNSFILLRHGRRCLECWVPPYTRHEPHQMFSLSKSFVSCALGLAQAEGRLTLTDRLASFFPEYARVITDERMRRATLRDLLTMRSGHLECARKYCVSDDWIRDYLASPLDTEPGTKFTYNSAASYMLSAVIRRVAGENVREYLLPRLFQPLGMLPGIWECCPQGINYGGWGLYLTTDDLAKFAQLLLQHGVWEGRQILPGDYLAAASQAQADNSANELPDWNQGYGYHFWRSRHGYRGDGASGQYAIMLEKEDIAIAVTSCLPDMGDILTAIWEELLPDLSDGPLPENPAAQRELADFLKRLSIPVVPAGVKQKAGFRSWEFPENSEGITACTVMWDGEECSLTFTCRGRREQLRAGFGHYANSTLQLTDERPHPAAASAGWVNEHTLEIRSFITDGIYRDIWTVDLTDETEPLRNEVKCNCFRPEKGRFLTR